MCDAQRPIISIHQGKRHNQSLTLIPAVSSRVIHVRCAGASRDSARLSSYSRRATSRKFSLLASSAIFAIFAKRSEAPGDLGRFPDPMPCLPTEGVKQHVTTKRSATDLTTRSAGAALLGVLNPTVHPVVGLHRRLRRDQEEGHLLGLS